MPFGTAFENPAVLSDLDLDLVCGRADGRLAPALSPVDRTRLRCRACGFGEVRTDEVLERGWVLLAECPHCDHRFTIRETTPTPAPSRRLRLVRTAFGTEEVDSAA